MKTTIGGDRLGSGNKQEISIRNYERSTHDISGNWRSSMAPGTLVPFMVLPALPGDTFDIELQCEIDTLPTVGPLFGSYKVQLDVFQCPIRLYNAALHMNKLGIGMQMDKVYLPQMTLVHTFTAIGEDESSIADHAQIHSSSLLNYLGIKGLGIKPDAIEGDTINRQFNAVPFIAYYDIFKQYYSNKQEENAYVLWGEGQSADIAIKQFPLKRIDEMREKLLQHNPQDTPYIIRSGTWSTGEEGIPYNLGYDYTGSSIARVKRYASQNGLMLKTYQSDLFNNWIQTEWIDGENGVNEITKVSTTGDEFTIDALNLAQKVYTMLNRIAISGGTYDDWLDAVYTHERAKSIENPVYHGSLIRELAFQEVISNAQTEEQPLGTLAGKGVLTNKNKGGRMKIKVDEHSYLMGIVSITPRIDYSQGNSWDVNLKTMDDFHKPGLDAIGFQDLITEQMAWQSTYFTEDPSDPPVQRSAGKQPAWINYMTEVDRTYGNFAEQSKEMFMTLNRRYEIDPQTGIADLTTYIDPSKYNYIFADTRLDAQNFWVQIRKNITARRKMSAKVIPNL